MASSETLPGPEITQTCPVVRPPNPEPTQSSSGGSWKGLAATTAVVMAVGGAAVGVNSLQADTRNLYSEMIHLAANRSAAVPAASPTVSFLAATPPQEKAPTTASIANGPAAFQIPAASASSAPQGPVAAECQNCSIDAPANGSVIDDDFVRVSGHVDSSVKGAIWVVLFPERSPGRGWPQSSDASRGVPAVRVGNTFRVGAFLGGPAQSYDIVVYSAAPEATRLFSAYLQQASLSGKHPGISTVDMPTSIAELARITVRSSHSHR